MQRYNCVLFSAACGIGALGLYLFTMAPVVQAFDSAELTVGAYALGIVHSPGYPLYMLLGHLFSRLPIGDVGWRLNFMSVVFGALTVAFLCRLLLTQTRHPASALIGSLLFATAPLFWSQAVRAEVYSLHNFLMVCVLIAACRTLCNPKLQNDALCFLLLGLSLANHLTTALLWGAVLVTFALSGGRRLATSLVLSCIGLIVAGVAYMYLPLRQATIPPVDYVRQYFDIQLNTPSGLIWMISGRAFRCSFYVDAAGDTFMHDVRNLADILLTSSLGIGLVLGAWGWRSLWKMAPRWNVLLTLYALANGVAFFAYHVVDKSVMFIPLILVGCIWVAHGADELSNWLNNHFPNTQPWATRIARHAPFVIIAAGVVLNLPSVDLSNNRRTHEFTQRLLERVAPSTIIVNHWVTSSVFDYLQLVERRRPDVHIFNLDFFFLGAQHECSTNGEDLREAWFNWLNQQQTEARDRPLCVIEPLPELPKDLVWKQEELCWMPSKAATSS